MAQVEETISAQPHCRDHRWRGCLRLRGSSGVDELFGSRDVRTGTQLLEVMAMYGLE